MMMNNIGKTLVFVQVALSLVLLSWGLAVFADPVDIGLTEPRRVYVDPPEGKKDNERVASEIDKRAAAVRKAVEAKHRALERVKDAQKNLDAIEDIYWQYRLAYNAEIAMLLASNKDLSVRAISFKGGAPVLDKKAATGLAYEPASKEAKLSIQQAQDLLSKRQREIKIVQERITKTLEQETQITLALTGKDIQDRQVNPGIYGLVEAEATKQKRLREEYEELEPLWVRELNAAQTLMARRMRLEKRLKELEE